MPKNNSTGYPSLGRAFTTNVIASAGSVVGLFGALAVIAKFSKDKKSEEK